MRLKIQILQFIVYIDHLSNIRNAIQLIEYGSSWKRIPNSGLNHTVLAGLKLCSFALSLQGAKEPEIKRDELIELQTQIEMLQEKIFELQIDEKLKKYILISLQKILEAIKYFRIGGATGLEEAIKQSIGNIYFYQAETQNKDSNHEEAQAFHEFSTLLNKLIILLNRGVEMGNLPLLHPNLELQLIDELTRNFNENEFKEVCIELDLDYEDLGGGGEGKRGKIRECISYLKRRKSLATLLNTASEKRPKVNWTVYRKIENE